MKPAEGRKRVIIEHIQPQVDCGRYPARRFIGDRVEISAAIFSDGHDHVSAELLYKHQQDSSWTKVPLTALPNDLWSGSFLVDRIGDWTFTIRAWVDHFDTWCADLRKRLAAQALPPALIVARDPVTSGAAIPDAANSAASGPVTAPQDSAVALAIGAGSADDAALRASGSDAKALRAISLSLRKVADQNLPYYEYPLTSEMEQLIASYPDHSFASMPDKELALWVDRDRVRFSSWYELFPRSTSP